MTPSEARSEVTTALMDPADQLSYVRGLRACLREAHCWQTSAPSAPWGHGEPPAPDIHVAKNAKTGQGGPPARPPTERGIPTWNQARPRRTSPLPRPRGTHTATSPPTPATTAVQWHPSPAARPGTATRTNPRRTGTNTHTEPGTGGDTLSYTSSRGGWTPRAAPATTSPTWRIPNPAPPTRTP